MCTSGMLFTPPPLSASHIVKVRVGEYNKVDCTSDSITTYLCFDDVCSNCTIRETVCLNY